MCRRSIKVSSYAEKTCRMTSGRWIWRKVSWEIGLFSITGPPYRRAKGWGIAWLSRGLQSVDRSLSDDENRAVRDTIWPPTAAGRSHGLRTKLNFHRANRENQLIDSGKEKQVFVYTDEDGCAFYLHWPAIELASNRVDINSNSTIGLLLFYTALLDWSYIFLDISNSEC